MNLRAVILLHDRRCNLERLADAMRADGLYPTIDGAAGFVPGDRTEWVESLRAAATADGHLELAFEAPDRPAGAAVPRPCALVHAIELCGGIYLEITGGAYDGRGRAIPTIATTNIDGPMRSAFVERAADRTLSARLPDNPHWGDRRDRAVVAPLLGDARAFFDAARSRLTAASRREGV